MGRLSGPSPRLPICHRFRGVTPRERKARRAVARWGRHLRELWALREAASRARPGMPATCGLERALSCELRRTSFQWVGGPGNLLTAPAVAADR
jgi:hypothetical protein